MQRLEDDHDPGECRNCGRHVTPAFVRVFGSADGTVDRCQGCDTVGRLMAGSAAGKHVQHTDPAADSTDATKSEPVLLADIRGDD